MDHGGDQSPGEAACPAPMVAVGASPGVPRWRPRPLPPVLARDRGGMAESTAERNPRLGADQLGRAEHLGCPGVTTTVRPEDRERPRLISRRHGPGPPRRFLV